MSDWLFSKWIGLDGLLAQQPGSFWLPRQAAEGAGKVDSVLFFIFYVSLFFFVLIAVLMFYFMIRYRRRSEQDMPAGAKKHLGLELFWTAVPIVVVAVIFYIGFKAYIDSRLEPSSSQVIYVTGQKWNWFFEYPNGYVDQELHVPVGEPIKLVMASEDVIHSLFIPAFRMKMDLVPGRYSKLWFEATETGVFPLYCAEYCGTGHSDMTTQVVVHEPGQYKKWLETASKWIDTMPPVQAGEILIFGNEQGRGGKGCDQCHYVDPEPGKAYAGPTFKDLFGHDVQFADGSSAVADEEYIRRSILEPQAEIVAGYEPVMPTYKGRITDQEVRAIIAYLRSVSEKGGQGETARTQPADGEATETQPSTQTQE